MDIIFKCSNCDQELAMDVSGAGTEIDCPSCSKTLVVPYPDPAAVAAQENVPPPAPVPPPPPPVKEEKHFTVPVHSAAPEALIQKSKAKSLETVAKQGGVRVKTIKRSDCRDGGKDNFDDVVTAFLEKVGQGNIVSVAPISYSIKDPGSANIFQDYGVIIIFKE